MGIKEDVRKGKISIDEALETAKDYHGGIRGWLIRFKESGKKPGKNKKGKSKKNNKESTNFRF
jgi:hypothetical protein